jgi:hypothetical protein
MKFIHIISALLLLIMVLTVQAQKPAPPADFTVVVDPALWSYSSADKHFNLWVPENTPVIKGIYIFVFHGCGQEFSEYSEMRKLATELHCAIVGFDKFHGYPGAGTVPSSILLDALKELATTSNHPEIVNAPIFTFGHSNATVFAAGFAGKEAARVFGWMAFKSAFGAQFSVPEIYKIPGLVISGETDDSYFQDQLTTVRQLRYRYGALMNMLIEPAVGHGPSKPKTYTILLAFMKTAFLLRVPADADPTKGPVKLNELQESKGWLGQTFDGLRIRTPEYKWIWEQPIDVRRQLEITPYADYPGDKRYTSWLPTEDFARKWQEFGMKGNIPQWSEIQPSIAITIEDRFAQAKRLESSDPIAAAAAYKTFAGTIFAKDAAAQLQDAGFTTRLQAREQLKIMWDAEIALQEIPRNGKFDAKFTELNKEPLAVINGAANVLITRFADNPDTQTARLLLARYKLPIPQP